MPGATNPITAVGPQNDYLTLNPLGTFWVHSYRTHAPFGIMAVEQTFNGQADFGRRVTCPISRAGDMLFRTYAQFTLPEINQDMGIGNYGSQEQHGVYARWLDYIGEHMIASVEYEIGAQCIDRHYGDWMHIWNQLTMPAEKQAGYHKMIGHTTQLTYITDPSFADIDGPCDASAPRQVCAPRNALPETTLYVPLQFPFCTNPGLALPLVALQLSDIKINLNIRPIDECLWAVTTLNCSDSTDGQYSAGRPVPAAIAYNQSLVSASLYTDMVFLSPESRNQMANQPRNMLITQLQFNGEESVGSSVNKIKINLSHPVKAIYWVVQPDAHVDYCGSISCGSPLFAALGAQPTNYTDSIDAVPRAYHAYGGPASIAADANAFIDARGQFQDAGALDYRPSELTSAYTGFWNGPTNPYSATNFGGPSNPYVYPNGEVPEGALVPADHNTGSGVSDAGTFVLAEMARLLHCWGQNPVVTAKLYINGAEYQSEREGSYYDTVQPFQYHTRSPDTGINMFSWALKPEDPSPSGSLNFSRCENNFLNMVLSNATVEGTKTAKVRLYATNFNVFAYGRGVGGVMFAT